MECMQLTRRGFGTSGAGPVVIGRIMVSCVLSLGSGVVFSWVYKASLDGRGGHEISSIFMDCSTRETYHEINRVKYSVSN